MVVQISKKRKLLAEDGCSGLEVQVTSTRTEIIILKRFGFSEGSVELYVGKVATRGLPILPQALRLPKDCEVVVSGKLQGQRAKSMKSVDSLVVRSEDPVNCDVDPAACHALLRQIRLSMHACKKPLPGHINSLEPKNEILPTTPTSEEKGGKPELPAMPQPALTA
ncbi:hypothetical protein ABFV05_015584 [Capra hircus]